MSVGLLLTSPWCAGCERQKHANQEFVVSWAMWKSEGVPFAPLPSVRAALSRMGIPALSEVHLATFPSQSGLLPAFPTDWR